MGSLVVFGYEVDFTFAVNADEQGCVVEVNVPPEFPADIGEIPCFETGQDFKDFLDLLQITGPAITNNDDGSWTIDSIPTEL